MNCYNRYCIYILCTIFTSFLYNCQINNYDTNMINPIDNIGLQDPIALRNHNHIRKKAKYFLLAPHVVQPDKPFKISVTILDHSESVWVKALIQKDGDEIGNAVKRFEEGVPGTLTVNIPPNIREGNYVLKVTGDEMDKSGGSVFRNITSLIFDPRVMAIMIQLDKPLCKQGQTVHFRVIMLKADYTPFLESVNVLMLDPKGHVVKRWLNRQSNLGSLSLEYQLGRRPEFGTWTISVKAMGQAENNTFEVEEYFEGNFEVNVTMPYFFVDTLHRISGVVEANYTYYVGVYGRALIEAYLLKQPVEGSAFAYKSPAHIINVTLFNGRYHFHLDLKDLQHLIQARDYGPNRRGLAGYQLIVNASVTDPRLNKTYFGFAVAAIFNSSVKLSILGERPLIYKPGFNFTFYVAMAQQDGARLPNYDGRFVDVSVRGGSRPYDTRVYFGSRDKIQSSHVNHDDVTPSSREWWEPQELGVSRPVMDEEQSAYRSAGIVRVDVPTRKHDRSTLRIDVKYRPDPANRYETGPVQVESRAVPADWRSTSGRFLSIELVTERPVVDGYAIFHVDSNFRVDTDLYYHIVSKGSIVYSTKEVMAGTQKTLSLALSAEMAPSSKILVYLLADDGLVISDGLNFHVDSTTRNNFSMVLNTKKDLNGYTVEVVCQGDPGSFVGLSGVDNAIFELQAGNDITLSLLQEHMYKMDTHTNSSFNYPWYSARGKSISNQYFPSPTYGIDNRRVISYAGLVALTDANVTSLYDPCNATADLLQCSEGSTCYPSSQRCDGVAQCPDFSDESGCWDDSVHRRHAASYRKWRLANLHRFTEIYDSSWLWKDFNIGSDGYYIFTAKVVKRPALWAVSAFSLSKVKGFGLLPRALEFTSTLPFYFIVDVPDRIKMGEQLGIRVALFNYFDREIEVMVRLEASECYESIIITDLEEGIVHSYSPETKGGERQVLSWVESGQSQILYIPIVFTKTSHTCRQFDPSGTVLRLTALTQIAMDTFEKYVQVDIGGVPQFYHTPYVIDLTDKAVNIFNLFINVTETPIIPLERQRLYLFGSTQATIAIMGDVVGPAFATMPLNAMNMVEHPYWCGEQVIFNFAANFYTLRYLQKTNQLGPETLESGTKYINIYYQRLMGHMRRDGAFCLFQGEDCQPSLWMTALAIQVLHEASRVTEWESLIYVDPVVLGKALSYLLTFYRSGDGGFDRPEPVSYDRKLDPTQSGPARSSADRWPATVPLTGLVAVALIECDDVGGPVGGEAATARMKALDWLADQLIETFGSGRTRDGRGRVRTDQLIAVNSNDTYGLAVTAYALSLGDHVEKGNALRALLARSVKRDDGVVYWCDYESRVPPHRLQNNQPHFGPREFVVDESVCIETTAYALLAILLNRSPVVEPLILPVIKWINLQRNTFAGFDSTRDTIVALQALTKYSENELTRPTTDINVEIQATSNINFDQKFHIDSRNLATQQTVQIPNVWGSVSVRATGRGLALLQLAVQKNIDWRQYQREPPRRAFDLTYKTIPSGFNSSILDFRICARWKLTTISAISGMSLIEVGLPSGYIVNQRDLDVYVNSYGVRSDRGSADVIKLRKGEFLPDHDKAVFYFDYLDAAYTCVNLTAERWWPIANMSEWHTIKVYEYYNPTHFNVSMYEAYHLRALDICHVCGSFQCPYCPYFNASPTPVPVAAILIISLLISAILSKFVTC